MKHPSDEVPRRLGAFVDLLRQWAVPLGMVAGTDSARIRERHVEDSLRALACLANASSLADVGSGAGLPGVPLAIARPDLEVVLIEPRRPRAAFLELCLETLGLRNARVVCRRSSTADVRVDICLARALGDAATSWSVAEPVLRPDGKLVYFAGRSWRDHAGLALQERGLVVEICAAPSFPWQGPLVKIGRGESEQPVGWRH